MAPLARRRPAPRSLALGLAALAAAAGLHLARPTPAAAAVTHLHGFRATVDGFTSWYGSYGMGALGTAWCIDHGSRAPDPTYRYAPTDLATVPDSTRSAVAWAVATHGQGTDRVIHAGLMLALHDLMGARYPSGRLDVDRLPAHRLAGFGGLEHHVLGTARAIKADALAHAGLRGPLRLTVAAGPLDAAGQAPVTVAVRDAAGQGVGGVAVALEGAGLGGTPTTGADGTIRATVRGGGAPVTVHATATVPHLPVDAWAPTTARAQRVARPTLDRLAASATVAPATGRLAIVKRGDATAWLPVEGARFRIEPGAGGAPHTITVGADGTAPPVTLPVGTYRVVEEEAPPGYDVAGPWTVVVEPGRTTTLEVTDAARRGRLRIHKVDARDGAPLAGASLEVRYRADADDSVQQPVVHVVTGAEPTMVEGLLPGPYAITEVGAPPGYARREEPVVVEVDAGATAEVVLPNTALPPPTTPPPTTLPPTTLPPTTAPPASVLAAPPVRPVRPESPASLPRTGADAVTLVLLGAGLVLVGSSLVELAPRPRA